MNPIEETDECSHEHRRQLFSSRRDGYNVFRCEDCGEMIRIEIDPVLKEREL